MEWISVEDRLPASDVLEVITYSPTIGVELVSTSWLTDFENDITHWMPLPECPKKNKGEK